MVADLPTTNGTNKKNNRDWPRNGRSPPFHSKRVGHGLADPAFSLLSSWFVFYAGCGGGWGGRGGSFQYNIRKLFLFQRLVF